MLLYILDDSDYPNAAPEKPEKPPKTMKEALESKSKPSKKKPSKKNAGARSLGGSRFSNIFYNTSIIVFSNYVSFWLTVLLYYCYLF